ncbi:MAG: TraR/DksA family transcriptional regulator [Smithellaceae bacterium]|nr:TraR/DksA family transcriptional regulator [Smithellaceae bacterium]
MIREKRIQLIRKTLVNKMEELWSNAEITLARMKKAEGTLADPFDMAVTESSRFVELACRSREIELLLDIKETILRIDRGLYGICDSCGRLIHEKRLCIEPMSKLCMDCQEEKEIQNRKKNGNWAMRGMSHQHG